MAKSEGNKLLSVLNMSSYEEDDGEEEEADFNPSDDDDDDESAASSSSDDSDDDSGEKDSVVVLSGSLTLNEERHVIYAGTWQFGKNIDASTTEARKFKLKSKTKFSKGNFDLCNPVGDTKQRSLLFHGFFITNNKPDEGDSSRRKIKEKDVEIIFTPAEVESKGNDNSGNCSRLFHIVGGGTNEYGSFTIKGDYKVSISSGKTCSQQESSESMSSDNLLVCEKTYTSQQNHKRSRRYDSDDDDQDGGADLEELAALHEEACMSVEELRKRYNSVVDENDGKHPPISKKKRRDESDDEYTF